MAGLSDRAKSLGLELLPLDDNMRRVAPSWARMVRVLRGNHKGLHAWWNTRKPRPHVEEPRGSAKVVFTPEDVVVDLGAYCGAYSVRAVNQGAGEVRAFEPSPMAFEALRRTAADLGIDGRNALVVGDDRKEDTLWVGELLGCTNSILHKPRNPRPVVVPATRFPLAVEGATVVKIDVEGAEYGYDLPGSIPSTVRALFLSLHVPEGERSMVLAGEVIRSLEEDEGFEAVVSPVLDAKASPLNREGLWVRDL